MGIVRRWRWDDAAQRIPMALALEMGLTGDPVTAEQAREYGLLDRVVPADRVLPEALALAGRIAANGPPAVAMTKKLMRQRRWCRPGRGAGGVRQRRRQGGRPRLCRGPGARMAGKVTARWTSS